MRVTYAPPTPKHFSETWFASQPPLPPVRTGATTSTAPVGEKIFGSLYFPGKEGAAPKKSQAVNARLADGFLLSSTGSGMTKDQDPVSQRKLNLGKTIDILKQRLPTLLQSPLPSEILSPSITLQLFPSTHPNLPSVRGRMAYIAALWTAPVVWGRIPGIKVRLEILSIKMIRGCIPLERVDDESQNMGGEQMIVKWRASSSPNGNGNGEGAVTGSPVGSALPPGTGNTSDITTDSQKPAKEDPLSAMTSSLPRITINGDFCGLFIFEFDDMGRIKTHIIEDVEEDKGESRQQHSKVITLTEWLLKKAKRSLEEKPPVPGLAFERIWQGGGGIRRNRFE
ncbi:hypothetical protein H072_2998 [Dactylellina haptotyla CBS 200.50]|uniref:Uncharacterized protein n=1 Tax=Dactylellina haptotyla (strain CBS 200.50) TaxID=1284197 RepID=S8APG6_DACHA|nr:hypothetical protein H072_2998 [Dactylellina haptotyla CBS 200.50]